MQNALFVISLIITYIFTIKEPRLCFTIAHKYSEKERHIEKSGIDTGMIWPKSWVLLLTTGVASEVNLMEHIGCLQ